jgi:hypothetical protein
VAQLTSKDSEQPVERTSLGIKALAIKYIKTGLSQENNSHKTTNLARIKR